MEWGKENFLSPRFRPKNGSLSDKGVAIRKVGECMKIAFLEHLLLCKFAAAVTLSQATQALSFFSGKQEGSSSHLTLSQAIQALSHFSGKLVEPAFLVALR